MFGIDSMEFAIIIVVAILVLGPDQLPKILRTCYKVMAEFRRISTEFQRAINLDSHFAEMEKAEAEAKAKKLEAQQTAKKKTTQKKKSKTASSANAKQAEKNNESVQNKSSSLTSPSDQPAPSTVGATPLESTNNVSESSDQNPNAGERLIIAGEKTDE